MKKKQYHSVTMFLHHTCSVFQLLVVVIGGLLSSSWRVIIVDAFSPATLVHSPHHNTRTTTATLPPVLSSPPLTPAIVVEEDDNDDDNEAGAPFASKDLSKRWKDFVPGLWEDPRGTDVTITWNAGDAAHKLERCEDAAHKLWKLAQMQGHKVPSNGDSFVVQDLTHFMLTYVEFCETHFIQPPKTYKARVVATRGPHSTKCPQWHFDHVPVRWIQALVGPGVEWVDPEAVQWENMNTLHEADNELLNSIRERNKLLVNEKLARRHQAPTGQAALLLGNTWSEVAKDGISTPCVHKSPSGFLPWEGRVVLYMDVVD